MAKYQEALEDFESAKKSDPKTANVDKNIEVAKKKLEATKPKMSEADAENAKKNAEEEAKKKEEEERKKNARVKNVKEDIGAKWEAK